MTKVKFGGIVLGGIGGYLLISKGIGVIDRCIRNVCTANQWKNYYKYGKDENMVPPGYSVHTHTDGSSAENGTATEAVINAVGESIKKAIDNTFGTTKAPEEASEGQTEASKEDICPKDCKACTMTEKCPYKNLRPEGGIITEWSEDGKPVAGKYPWEDGSNLEWFIRKQEHEGDTDGDNGIHVFASQFTEDMWQKVQESTAGETEDTLYKETLEDGVVPADKEE